LIVNHSLQSLIDFRLRNPPRSIFVRDTNWKYVAAGDGEETILFLHGMAGSCDIWWQIFEGLQDKFRLIAVTCPPLDKLASLAEGIHDILDKERADQINLVGTSFGGYLAQYLAATRPERILRAVFSNTYAQPDFIAKKYRLAGLILPLAPEWLIMSVLRWGSRSLIYPTSSYSEVTLAYLTEQASGELSKAQIVSRYQNLVEPFQRNDLARLNIPILIVESENDPLIEPLWREDMKTTYPSARVERLKNGGHFPYLSMPEAYLGLLEDFFRVS
jgi:maspardin